MPTREPQRLLLQSAILSGDSARRDSASTTAAVLLRPGAGGVEVLLLREDGTTATDSLPPIASDSTGAWSRAELALPCREPGPLPSPLVIRLAMPRYARAWPVRDSLRYTTCTRGATRRVRVEVQWQAPEPAADQTNYTQQVLLSGTIDGDSTRAFPMRTRATVRGDGRLKVSAPAGRILESAGSVTVDVDAMANALRQRARQVVVFVATPRP